MTKRIFIIDGKLWRRCCRCKHTSADVLCCMIVAADVFLIHGSKSDQQEQHAYECVAEARDKLGKYLDFFNRLRPHSSLNRQTPDMVNFNTPYQVQAA